MVEVFKTNVSDQANASIIIGCIHRSFVLYEANFDLEDCDHILRVKSVIGEVHVPTLIDLVSAFGFHAEILTDEDPIRNQRFVYLQS